MHLLQTDACAICRWEAFWRAYPYILGFIGMVLTAVGLTILFGYEGLTQVAVVAVYSTTLVTAAWAVVLALFGLLLGAAWQRQVVGAAVAS